MSTKVKVIVKEHLLGYKQKEAINDAACELCKKMQKKDQNQCKESILKEVWPALNRFTWSLEPVLELRPLNRVGGEPGKSGISVLAGRFYADSERHKKSALPSRQMVIKISPEPNGDVKFVEEKRKDLIDEWNSVKNLWQKFKSRDFFARPVWLFNPEIHKPAVLWAPFESPDRQYVRGDINSDWDFINVLESIKYLGTSWSSTSYQDDHDHRKEKLIKMVNAAGHLFDAHSVKNAKKVKSQDFKDHYEWELRGFGDLSQKWYSKWHNLWGDSKTISDFGKKWPNPITVYKNISKLSTRHLRMGYIHGDLHPRNIVFAGDDEVKIIDFGWARPQKRNEPLQHIVKDFVLLEANFRFVTLPPFLPYDSLKKFLGWINSQRTPRVIHNECKLRIELIKELREIAQKHIGKYKNWDIEYIVPLFLVSLGLLKYCHSADCSWAARYTVLSLAKYLKNNLL